MLFHRLRHILILAALAATAAQAAEDAPGWLREASTRTLPAYDAKVPAVYLLREKRAIVDGNGRIVYSTREALKVLSREGRAEARAYQIYETGNSKVRDMRAWMLAPSGELLKLSKEASFDRASTPKDTYTDIRVRGVDARDKADPGSVFGFEIVTEDRALFSQMEWSLQNRLPALISRYMLTLPAGWTAQGTTFNGTAVQPVIDGSTYTWEARDLPFVDPEPAGPHLSSLVPRLAITYQPPAGVAPAAPMFASWKDVSRWATDMSEAQAQPNDAILAKAQTLTARATTEMARIQTLGWFVQGFKYVEIQTGVGRGGGYRPRAAPEVFTKEYGDCKDKATLMRALLKAVGIQSYLVIIYSSDSSYVQQGWPSPQQFNHAIVAIKVSDSITAGAVIEHPALGRLMVFDPTSGSTPAGDLPLGEQGSLALVAAGDRGELIRMPTTPPSSNRLEREIRATLDEHGTLSAKMAQTALGQSAAAERGVYNSQPLPEYKKMIENWISLTAKGAQFSKIEPADAFLEGRFGLQVEFEAPEYAQLRANRLMIFKPAMVNRRQTIFLTERKRSYPVLLRPTAYNETVHVKLPPGFKVDELPDAAKIEVAFGKYMAACAAKDDELVCTRTLEIRPATVPVAQYQTVREFYEHILSAEQTPVVLVRQ